MNCLADWSSRHIRTVPLSCVVRLHRPSLESPSGFTPCQPLFVFRFRSAKASENARERHVLQALTVRSIGALSILRGSVRRGISRRGPTRSFFSAQLSIVERKSPATISLLPPKLSFSCLCRHHQPWNPAPNVLPSITGLSLCLMTRSRETPRSLFALNAVISGERPCRCH